MLKYIQIKVKMEEKMKNNIKKNQKNYLELKNLIMEIKFEKANTDINDLIFGNELNSEQYKILTEILNKISEEENISLHDLYHKNFFDFVKDNLEEIFEYRTLKYSEIDDLISLEEEYWKN